MRVFDDRSFFTAVSQDSFSLDRHQIYRETGAIGLISYPFTRYHRIDVGAGYESRQIAYPQAFDVGGGQTVVAFVERRDNFPLVTSTFSGDTTIFKQFGPISGHRYDLSASYAPDLKGSGTLTQDLQIDARQYLQITSRSLLAARLFAGYSSGNVPNFYYFGTLPDE